MITIRIVTLKLRKGKCGKPRQAVDMSEVYSRESYFLCSGSIPIVGLKEDFLLGYSCRSLLHFHLFNFLKVLQVSPVFYLLGVLQVFHPRHGSHTL
jgi:hypothetical protein